MKYYLESSPRADGPPSFETNEPPHVDTGEVEAANAAQAIGHFAAQYPDFQSVTVWPDANTALRTRQDELSPGEWGTLGFLLNLEDNVENRTVFYVEGQTFELGVEGLLTQVDPSRQGVEITADSPGAAAVAFVAQYPARNDISVWIDAAAARAAQNDIRPYRPLYAVMSIYEGLTRPKNGVRPQPQSDPQEEKRP